MTLVRVRIRLFVKQPIAESEFLVMIITPQKIIFNSLRYHSSKVFALALLLCAGCGDKSLQLTPNQTKVFDDASAEVKQAWEKALVADKANNYVEAQTLLSNLNDMVLSDPQRKVLDDERAAFGQRLMQAADKNDPAAIQAAQMALKGQTRR